MRVLVVENEIRLAEMLRHILKKNNYGVDLAVDGISGQELAETGIYDLIILDWMLPEKDGLKVLEEIRKNGVNTPVIMLSLRDAVSDRVKALDCGADDYLIKPFSNDELLARLRALGRRKVNNIIQNETLCLASLTFFPFKGEIKCGKKTMKLTPKESQLLELFLRNKNQVLTKEQLFDKVWGLTSEVGINNLEVYLSLLRKKLKALKCPVEIETIRGMGYFLRSIT